MLKLTITLDEMEFSCDYSKLDPDNRDILPPVDSAIYDMLYLLSCVYDRESVAETLFSGNDFMENAENGLERLTALRELQGIAR